MKQRIGTNKPGIIILDELLNGLDSEERRTVKEIFKKMSNEAIILLSSHVLAEIEELGGKVLMLEDGHLILNSDK